MKYQQLTKGMTLDLIFIFLCVLFGSCYFAYLRHLHVYGSNGFTAIVEFFMILTIFAMGFLCCYFTIESLCFTIAKVIKKVKPYFYKQKKSYHLHKTIEISVPDAHIIEKKIEESQLYTKKIFESYANAEQIDIIFENIVLVIEKKDFNNLRKVTISTNITPLDLYHYGWNIWKHFNKIKRFIKMDQLEIATFLKHTFPETLKKVDEYSIKSHLKDDNRVGIITIKEDISK